MRIILIGAQGSGKGTQAALLAKKKGIPHIAPGDILREEVAAGTEHGIQAKTYMDKGKMVPDYITNALVKARLSKPDCQNGYILDGYPRDRDQALALEDISPPDIIIELKIPDAVAIKRISRRRICPKDQTTYGIDVKPKKSGVCDKCGTKLIQRADDKPAAVKKRLEIYHHTTEPLIDYYKPREIVYSVDASKPIDEVFAEMCALLGI